MERYPVPAQKARAEITVVNSRFVATAAPSFSVNDAKAFIAEVKDEYSDAAHNVPAFIIGHGKSLINHCNDDGEPSGTAGRPVLSVLKGSGLGDVTIVVTRYFGGTKLGTGGLVRAYSDAARAVIKILPLAEKVQTHTVMIGIPYNWIDRLRRLTSRFNGKILDEIFAAEVTITAQFPISVYPTFLKALNELSHGSLNPEIIETQDTIIPLPVGGLI